MWIDVYILLLLVAVCYYPTSSQSLARGSTLCTTGGYSIIPGDCKHLSECPSALSNLRAGVNPARCYEEDGNPFVCCPNGKRISERKCNEYRNTYPELQRCSNSEEEMVSKYADVDEVEYTVALGFDNPFTYEAEWTCSGALISDQFILTSASCLTGGADGDHKITKVLLGSKQLSQPYDSRGAYRSRGGSQRIEAAIQGVYIHPEYSPPQIYHDLALVKLDRVVPSIRPICLPKADSRPEKENNFVLAGWGGLHEGQEQGGSSPNLERVGVERFSKKDCTLMIQMLVGNASSVVPQGLLKSQLCAGDVEGDDEGYSCIADNGGPLMVRMMIPPDDGSVSCQEYLIGVVSFGTGLCKYGGMPVVYTNVQSYLDWIESIVWEESQQISY